MTDVLEKTLSRKLVLSAEFYIQSEDVLLAYLTQACMSKLTGSLQDPRI